MKAGLAYRPISQHLLVVEKVTLNLDAELAGLDPRTAMRFKLAVMAMLRVVKARETSKHDAPFGERIARHPAIGTWPAELAVDQHIAELREEWER